MPLRIPETHSFEPEIQISLKIIIKYDDKKKNSSASTRYARQERKLRRRGLLSSMSAPLKYLSIDQQGITAPYSYNSWFHTSPREKFSDVTMRILHICFWATHAKVIEALSRLWARDTRTCRVVAIVVAITRMQICRQLIMRLEDSRFRSTDCKKRYDISELTNRTYENKYA